MKNLAIFDKWFNSLSPNEQEKLLTHIKETKIATTIVGNEGFFTGASGENINEGFFTGSSGTHSKQVCEKCNRPI